MLSYADLDYDDLNRSFSLGPVKQRTETASTDGQSMGVMMNAGYNIFASDRAYRLGPLVGYEYVRVEVDGYREDGSDATALNVDDQDVGSSVFSFGGFASLDLGLCDCELYTDVVYRKDTSTDPNDPRIGLVSVEGNMATLPGYQVEDDDSWRWNLGLAANFTPAVQFNISAGGEDSDGQSDFWYGAELSYSF
jgi:outer membrane lipase/esterase